MPYILDGDEFFLFLCLSVGLLYLEETYSNFGPSLIPKDFWCFSLFGSSIYSIVDLFDLNTFYYS